MYQDGNLVRRPNAKLVLFQGDSITDNYRSKDCDTALSSGYPSMIAGIIGAKSKQPYDFLNRGISGNRVVDLLARWKKDCLNLKPDFLSILIGVNDVWHELFAQNGVDAELYSQVYDLLLSQTLKVLPKVQLIVMEPFVLPGTSTAVENSWEIFFPEVRKRAEMCKKVAQKHGALYIELQSLLDQAAQKYGADEVCVDGVHPTALGHYLIAQQWIASVDLGLNDN